MCKQQDDSRITERWHKSNIYDLAAETGLSIATISRYINNKGNVAQKSTVKIEKAIQKLSYSPSMTARGLATGTVNIIGLDCSMAVVKSDYGFQFISGAHEKALEEGYNILLLNPEGDEEEYCSHMLSQNMITGFLCSEASKERYARAFYQKGLAVSYTGHRKEWDDKGLNVYGGFSDYRIDGINRFLKSGCRRLLLIEMNDESTARAKELLKEAFEDQRIDIINEQGKTLNDMYKILTEYIREHDTLDGIYFIQDHLHGQVYSALANSGKSIPEDIKLLTTIHCRGREDQTMPPMSCVFINAYEMGRRAVEKVICQLQGRDVSCIQTRVPYEFIFKGTL